MFKAINDGKLPTRGSKYSACIDLYANEDVSIKAGETVVIGLGVCIDFAGLSDKLVIEGENLHDELFDNAIEKIYDFQPYYEFLSSNYLQLDITRDLRVEGLMSGTDIINMGETGELKIIIHNPIGCVKLDSDSDYPDLLSVDGDKLYIIKKGDHIAQITLVEHKSYLFGIDIKQHENCAGTKEI